MQSWTSAHACSCSLFGASVLKSRPGWPLPLCFSVLFVLPSCVQGEQATSRSVPEIGGDGAHPGHLCRWPCRPHSPPGGHHCHHPQRVSGASDLTHRGPLLLESLLGTEERWLGLVEPRVWWQTKYVEGCQPGHWACGLTHTGQWESETQQRALSWLEHRSGWCQVPLSRNEYSAWCQGAVLEAGTAVALPTGAVPIG